MSNEKLLDGFILKEQMKDKSQQKKNPHPTKKADPNDLFTDLSNIKISSIQDMITDINQLIQTREQLKNEMFADLEKTKMILNSIIDRVPLDVNNLPALTAEHLKLRQKMIELEESKTQEKLNCWRDVALLKKELREHMREVHEKESNLGILGKIMKED